jgi:TolA-binding protein
VRFSSFAIGAGLVLALGIATGCADESSNVNQLNQNEFALRGMIASDRQQIDSLKTDLRRTQDELAELKHGGPVASAAGAPPDVNERLARLESQLNALQATLPPISSGAAGAEAPPPPPSSGTPGESISRSSSAGMSSPPPTSPPAEAGPGPEPPFTWSEDLDKEIASAPSSKETGAKIYRKALSDMKAKNYKSAIVEFSKIEHSYPKSTLAEASQYFIANSFYEMGQYEQAILHFNDLVMRFPNGRFTCQALLRESRAFILVNDKVDAKPTLRTLTTNNNCGVEAIAAKDMLKRLDAE